MTAPVAKDAWSPAPSPLTRRGVLVLKARHRHDRRRLLLASMVVLLGLVAVAVAYLTDFADASSTSASAPGAVGRMRLPSAISESAVIYDTAVMPLAPAEASAINAERPVDVASLVPAQALRIASESAAGLGYAAALRCLTQAVYYEAASEPDQGQRAVAQTVLNRVRHPAFPNTVCGVVFQGSERVTGCQFSFTCDGSLARTPSVHGWARAERVAREALSGRVEAAVGNATHYHANYVVPYWAPTLDKAATIGAHIFYLMRGVLGSPRAFHARYDIALEASPVAALAAAVEENDPNSPAVPDPLALPSGLAPQFQAPAEDDRSGKLIPGLPEQRPGRSVSPILRADEQRGELKISGPGGLKADDRTPKSASPSAASPERR
jgi:hypothetical protein